MTLAEARQRKNMTQNQLAELTDMTQTQLSRIESGWCFPFQSSREKINKVLGVEVDYVSTRLQKPCHRGFMENETEEDTIYRTITTYIKSGQMADRPIRFKVIEQFIIQLRQQLSK